LQAAVAVARTIFSAHLRDGYMPVTQLTQRNLLIADRKFFIVAVAHMVLVELPQLV